jgi:uncharacterized protein (TIGR02231 family)
MKKILFFIVLSLIVLDAKSGEPVKVKSKVKEATIFFLGAEVIHETDAQLAKGANELIIQGLCPTIDKNSIRVKASNGVLISSFEFIIEPVTVDNEIKKVQDTLNNYRADIGTIQTKLRINNSFLAALQDAVSKSNGSKENSTDDIIKLMDYYYKKMKETEETISQLKIEESELSKKISELNIKMQQSKTIKTKDKGALKLTLSSPAASNCTFKLMYYTSLASWVPYHDINVSSTDSPVKIISKAKVMQSTGVEWEQVTLRLSTSMPSFGKTVPLFNAWILQQQRPQAVLRNLELSNMQNVLSYKKTTIDSELKISDDEDFDFSEVDATMDEHVVLSDNNLNITYDIDLPYTIPGNGTFQNIELQTREIAAEYKYYCAPKLDPNTFLLAEINNWEKLNLLSGNANITYNDTYIGETYIDAGSTKDALTLTLGVDKRVAVKREKVNEMSSKKPFGNDIKQEFTYRITVRNNQNNPVNMVLKDQYPKSIQKQIEVILSKETTKPTFNNEDVGVITWEHKLEHGESRTFTISYSVKYPKETQLDFF